MDLLGSAAVLFAVVSRLKGWVSLVGVGGSFFLKLDNWETHCTHFFQVDLAVLSVLVYVSGLGCRLVVARKQT